MKLVATTEVSEYIDDDGFNKPWAGLNVKLIWTGAKLDRPSTHSTSIRNNARGRKIVDAYCRAVADGAVFRAAKIVKDNAGQTYVHADVKVPGLGMGKYWKSALEEMGYL